MPLRSVLFGDVDGDRRAEPFDRLMQVVPDLQRERMRACGQLHVDDVVAVAEMHPWGRARNRRSRRQALGVNRHVVVAHLRPRLGDRALGHRRYQEIFRAEFKAHRACHSSAICWLQKERSGAGWRWGRLRYRLRYCLFCRLRLATGRAGQNEQSCYRCLRNTCCWRLGWHRG